MIISQLNTPEDVLIWHFKKGRTRALEQLLNKYHAGICNYAMGFVLDREISKDIAAEVFITLWNKRGEFERIQSIKSFLYISTRNACLNKLRHDKIIGRCHSLFTGDLVQEEMRDVVVHRFCDEETLRKIYRLIDTLPQQCRQVLQLTLQGLDTNDIAEVMDLAAQTVRNTRIRATVLLKKRLSAEEQ